MKKGLWLVLLSIFQLVASCSAKKEAVRPNGLSDKNFVLPDEGIYSLHTSNDLDVLLNQIGDARYVLLGEASHGTAEFYTWRATITRRLIQEKGFNIIAVEGDWPAAYEVNQYIQGEKNAGSAGEVLQNFNRWPTWMWANEEIAELVTWLRDYNDSRLNTQKVGFYGLDAYSLWESIDVILNNFPEADEATLQAAREAKACLAPYNRNEQAYAQATVNGSGCAQAMVNLLKAVQARRQQLPERHLSAFNAEQNALVAVNGERYYQAMVWGGASSWNIRDRHMMETINRLMAQNGSNAKTIVWEHNTHVGDARYTDMAEAGMVNVGQLVREQHRDKGVFIVGFGTYEGTVIASNTWGGPVTTMTVPPAQTGSWEAALHQKEPLNKIINLTAWRTNETLTQRRGHRAIGVEYNPRNESGNYVPSDLPNRYDAFIYIDKTQALHPLVVNRVSKISAPTTIVRQNY